MAWVTPGGNHICNLYATPEPRHHPSSHSLFHLEPDLLIGLHKLRCRLRQSTVLACCYYRVRKAPQVTYLHGSMEQRKEWGLWNRIFATTVEPLHQPHGLWLSGSSFISFPLDWYVVQLRARDCSIDYWHLRHLCLGVWVYLDNASSLSRLRDCQTVNVGSNPRSYGGYEQDWNQWGQRRR